MQFCKACGKSFYGGTGHACGESPEERVLRDKIAELETEIASLVSKHRPTVAVAPEVR